MITLIFAIAVGGGSFAAAYWPGDWRLGWSIFAGVMGVPLIGISYDPKIDRFLDSIGEDPVGDLETLTADVLLAAVEDKWQRRKAIRQHNAALLKKQRGLAEKSAELAVELLDKGQ